MKPNVRAVSNGAKDNTTVAHPNKLRSKFPTNSASAARQITFPLFSFISSNPMILLAMVENYF